jgi:hypothetical protein
MTKQKQLTPPDSMTLAEVRRLLNELPGKDVRGRSVDSVWMALTREGDGSRPYQLCVVLECPDFRPGACTLERVMAMIFRTQSVECACRDEEELRRVIQDPSQGEWCFDDEDPSWFPCRSKPNAD